MSQSGERAVTFKCCDETMIGVMHTPARDMRDVGVLIVVGGPQYRVGSHRQFVLMARALSLAGFAVFRFDHRGMGDSEGGARSFQDVRADLASAIDTFMSLQPSLTGVIPWGLCDGASAILMYCRDDARTRGAILVNPWVRTEYREARAYLHHYYVQRLLQPAWWRSVLAGRVNPVKAICDFVATFKASRGGGALQTGVPEEGRFVERMLAGLTASSCPVLALISEHDLTAKQFMDLVATDARWGKAVESRVVIQHIAGADHTFSTRKSLTEATAICTRWLAERSEPAA
jgi:exosortase A-associated hydrolase 1